MSQAVAELLTILDLEQIEDNIFRGHSPRTAWGRVFGGLVISQALVAAARTVEGRAPHSLHGYFILPGDPSLPIVYEVDRIRDGTSFATRRCIAIQRGKAIFSLSASFHIEEEGLSHQFTKPDVPDPETLLSAQEIFDKFGAQMPPAVQSYFKRERPIELRPIDWMAYLNRKPTEPVQRIWIKATGPLPDDQAVHRAVLAYLSDMTLLDSAMITHGRSVFEPSLQVASLDHALWFHRPFRADEWLLYSQDSPWTGGARGLTRGLIYTRDGTLVASVAQEGLIRPREPRA